MAASSQSLNWSVGLSAASETTKGGYCPERAASPRRTVRAFAILAINRVSFWECLAADLGTLNAWPDELDSITARLEKHHVLAWSFSDEFRHEIKLADRCRQHGSVMDKCCHFDFDQSRHRRESRNLHESTSRT